MPELPEVETVRRELQEELAGYRIHDIIVDRANLVRGSVNLFKETLVGSEFTKVRRRAKLLVFDLKKQGQELHFVAHLKMTGRFLVRKLGLPKDKYQHVMFILDSGKKEKELRFCDLRQFGYLQVVTNEELKTVLEGYGPEPLDDLTLPLLESRLKRKAAVKKLLLDQKLFSGIGNIYANEALFGAGVHPERIANTLSHTEVSKLFTAINKVIESGLTYHGTTTRDESFRDVFDKPGDNARHLKVYERAGKPCLGCSGQVKKIMLGGRGTYFCPDCQH